MSLKSFAFASAVFLTFASVARADEEFDVSVAGATVKVATKPGWHINQEYPWKLVWGDKKIDKSQFKLSEHAATVEAPKGTGKLRGAVCYGEAQCKPFETTVTVK